MKNHQGHKIISIKEINEKAEKARAGLQKARKTKDLKQIELKSSLEAEGKRQKRQLDEIIDQEISQLSMLKKKLYKEVDMRIISEKEDIEHQLLSENLSRYCKSTEKILEDWGKNQETSFALQILEEIPSIENQEVHQSYENQVELYKAEIPKKHALIMSEVLKNLSFLSNSSAKLKKLFISPKKNDPAQNLLHVEIDYLTSVFHEYNLISTYRNGFFELKVNNSPAFTPKFDPSHFTCNLQKISLNFLDVLPNANFVTIYYILLSMQTLKDMTIHLQKVNNSDLIILFNLIFNLKTLEKFHVQMDLTDIAKPDVRIFMENLANTKNLCNLDIQYKNPHTIISLKLVQLYFPVPPLTTLQEISLNLECVSEVCGTLHTLNSHQAKSLKILKLSLGKTECNPQALEAVCETLRQQNNLEDLSLTCEELSDGTSSDLSKLLTASTQKKKLGISVNRVSVRENPTKFLPKSHTTLQDLEEFSLKIKYNPRVGSSENFNDLTEFLSGMKIVKKLCLKFDGVDSDYYENRRLFSHIVKLKTLVSLEIDHIQRYCLPNCEKRVFENLFNRLPSSVTKKLMLKRSEDYLDYDDGWGDESDYSGYSDEEADYLGGSDDDEAY